MFCEYCGKQISANDNYCTHCGKKISNSKLINQVQNKSQYSLINNNYIKNYFQWLLSTLPYPFRENSMKRNRYFGIISIFISFILSSFITIELFHYTERDLNAAGIMYKLGKGSSVPLSNDNRGLAKILFQQSNSDQIKMLDIYLNRIYSVDLHYSLVMLLSLFLLLIITLVFSTKLFNPINTDSYTDIINDYAIKSNWCIIFELICIAIIPLYTDSAALLLIVAVFYLIFVHL